MKIEVKLYSYHDMDLVSLYKTGRVSFPETTRQILNSYANKEAYKVRLFEVDEKRLTRYPSDSYRKYYHYHVVLDEKDDADAVGLLKRITPGYRNNFIKAILRQYLCGAFISDYSIDGDSRFFDEMSRRFQGDREERDIKLEKKKRKKEQKHLQKEKIQKITKKKATQKQKAIDAVNKSEEKNMLKETVAENTAAQKAVAATDRIEKQVANHCFEQAAQIAKRDEKKSKESLESNNLCSPSSGVNQASGSPYPSNYWNEAKSNNEDVPPVDNSDDSFEDDFDDFLGGTTEQY